jgi:hypothetical protein
VEIKNPTDKRNTIFAKGTSISIILRGNTEDYISLTDIARYKNPDEPKDVVKNWLRSKSTIEFLGLWERINNPDFKGVEFDPFKNEAGSNTFTMSPQKWIKSTNAVGIISKSGRYGGTYAHTDIAFEFASWISAEFKLYIIKDYQRLKAEKNNMLSLEWNVSRIISKINYRIHTDAIKHNLIPEHISRGQKNEIYSSEADLLNVALFGKTALEWSNKNPYNQGNMRDGATIQQLIVLSNIESMNSELIKQDIPQTSL